MSRDDLELVRAALRAEPWAVTRFGERMQCLPRFARYISRRIGVRLDDDEIADLAQAAFLIVWNKLPEFRGESRLESWSYRIIKWELANVIRRRDRTPNQLDDPMLVQEHRAEEEHFDEHQRLHEAIRRLPPRLADVILLKHFEGLTFTAIAARLGIPPETAKTRYYRGLQLLREWLRQKPGDPTA